MRPHALATLVATGALAVTASGVVAAFAVDDDDAPEVSVMPSVTASLVPAPESEPEPEVSVVPSVTRVPTPTVAPPSPVLPVPDPTPTGRTIRYTVRPGDTLSEIAAWFTLNGYRGLYEANRRVIGADPDRITPGQVYTISGGRMRRG